MRRIASMAAAALVVGGLATAQSATATSGTADPPLSVPESTLAAALHCPGPFDDTREPVLLVHGTFTNDDENYSWNYTPDLTDAGFDVCTVTLPNRSLDDIQVQAEYVVHAIRQIAAASGRQVDILGHSQGGLQPRWATRFFPHTRALVDDLVTLATPHHGTTAASLQAESCGACFQMSPSSNFLARLNSQDETPGAVDYTSIWTEMADELVAPQPAASTLGGGGANVANIAVQGVCPGRPVDHVSIVSDAVVHSLVLDAITQTGPANVGRAAPDCTSTSFVPPDRLVTGTALLQQAITNPNVPEDSRVDAEPATTFYARAGQPTFADVPRPHWAYWEIEWVEANGIATGSQGQFFPDAPWSRAQAVMWLWRLAGQPTGAPDTDFDDVGDTAWYHDGLDWTVDEGIVTGFPDHTFRPHDPVNRGQTAFWLWAFAGSPGDSPPHGFSDVPVGAWYDDGLRWVADQEIVTGFPDGTYHPRSSSTRAAVARMLFRLHVVLA